MKKLLFFLLFFASCKKDSVSNVKIQVIDAITNTPIKGVEVGIHRCTLATNPLCGLVAYRSAITGDNGICSFKVDDYAQTTIMKAFKTDYWGISGPASKLLIIHPEGWMQLHIIRGANYPPQSSLNITIHAFPGVGSQTHYNIAADSSIMVRGFGGLSNQVDWDVYDPSSGNKLNSGTWNLQIPRLSTVNATLNY